MQKEILNERQKRFVQAYLQTLNATQAAITAGYSANTAHSVGPRMLDNAGVKRAIQEGIGKVAAKADITTERILNELARIAFGSMRDIAEWNASGVSFKDSASLTDDAAATISEVTETTNEHGGSLKIKQHDKLKALELLGKYQKLFSDGGNVNVNVGFKIVVEDYANKDDRAKDSITTEAEVISIKD